jgi:hypothetical protein
MVHHVQQETVSLLSVHCNVIMACSGTASIKANVVFEAVPIRMDVELAGKTPPLQAKLSTCSDCRVA